MIDFITGTVKFVQSNSIVIDIGSIGLLLQVHTSQLFKEAEKTTLHAHMHWNQEQGPTLFGFSSELEREVFRLVISCSGIGPKIGLAVLRDLGAEQFLQAVQMDDDRTLGTVGGLGPKKVEQMIVQLKRKVAKLIKSGVQLEGARKFTDWQNVSDVLASLNYSRTEVARAMKHLSDNYAQENLPFDGLIRHALSFLTKKR